MAAVAASLFKFVPSLEPLLSLIAHVRLRLPDCPLPATADMMTMTLTRLKIPLRMRKIRTQETLELKRLRKQVRETLILPLRPRHSHLLDIHIRIQQRNGRKTLTTVEGIPSRYDLKKILRVIKKQFSCNGTVVNDEKVCPQYLNPYPACLTLSKAGGVIQLQGDQRNAMKEFLVDKEKGLEIDPKTIKVHGF